MGSCFSKIRKRFHKKIDIRVLLLGLDNAGKTTTLYRLKVQSGVSTVPTIGFNVESYLLNEYYKLNIWVSPSCNIYIRMLVDRIRSDHYGGTTMLVQKLWLLLWIAKTESD